MALPKADTLPVGHTQAAQEMNPNTGRVYKNDERLVSANDVFERRPEGYDFTAISRKEIEAMGVDYDTHGQGACLIRNEDIYMKTEMKSRYHEFLQPGGRIIPTDPRTGKPYMNGDLVWGFRSNREMEMNEQIQKQESEQYLRDLESPHSQLGDTPRYEKHRISADDSRQQHERNRADGMIGPTAGQDWRDVVRRNPKRYERDKLESAFGGRHVRPDEGKDNYEAGTQPRRQESAQGKASGIVHGSIPANPRPRNFMGAKK